MILRVILKNFLSFNDEVQFDMFPNMKRTTLSNHITMLNEKLPVLNIWSQWRWKIQFVKGYQFLESNSFEQKFSRQGYLW